MISRFPENYQYQIPVPRKQEALTENRRQNDSKLQFAAH